MVEIIPHKNYGIVNLRKFIVFWNKRRLNLFFLKYLSVSDTFSFFSFDPKNQKESQPVNFFCSDEFPVVTYVIRDMYKNKFHLLSVQ